MNAQATAGSLISAVFPLIGVVVGGAIAYFVNRRSLKHGEWLAKRDFRTKKLEELHGRLIALETYGRHTYTGIHQAFDNGNYKSIEVHHGLSEIEFLIKALFPSRLDLFDRLNDVTINRFGHLIACAIVESRGISPAQKIRKIEEASECMQDLDRDVAVVKQAIYQDMQEMIGTK